jgi:hypothetical protein
MSEATAGMTEAVMSRETAIRPAQRSLCIVAIAAGISASILFLVLGLSAELLAWDRDMTPSCNDCTRARSR